MSPTSPIVVLDSGLGGLTVVDALRRRLPDERVIYFGDTARLPYGSKTRETVGGFVKQIIQWGLAKRPKHVVIACNTASALALDDVRRHFPGLSVSGVIAPGATAAVEAIARLFDGARYALQGLVAVTGRIPPLAAFGPVLAAARKRVAKVTGKDVAALLGFDPLEVIRVLLER